MLRREFLGTALAAGMPARPAGGNSCILLVLPGAPGQSDTFDPKPDAPSGIRSPFKTIRTAAPEIQLTELFPLLAKQARKFSLLRSMHHPGQLLHDEGMRLALGTWQSGRVLLPGPAFAENCVAARRMVESGIRTVTVQMYDTAFAASPWDNHGFGPFSTMQSYRDVAAPAFDFAVSKLLSDLDERGLLKTTLVATISEFGRTPRINPNGGRDHWTKCWTSLLAGGGIEGGQILGTSDAKGAEPRDNPTTPAMLLERIERTLTSRTQT